MPSGFDAFLWYNVGEWREYGLAVANYGNDGRSQNANIRYLVEVIGRNLAAAMWNEDSVLRGAPSINTIHRIHKLCTRARSVIASRAVSPGTLNMETVHASPAWEDFILFPTPYFTVRNPFMKEYCGLALLALTEAMQHKENSKSLEISEDFGKLIGQFFQRIYVRMSVELLQIPMAVANANDFTLTAEQLAAYNPSAVMASSELIDTVAKEWSRPTEDDLSILTDGIAASMLPKLPRWPTNGAVVLQGQGSAAATNNGEAAAAAGPSFLGSPSV